MHQNTINYYHIRFAVMPKQFQPDIDSDDLYRHLQTLQKCIKKCLAKKRTQIFQFHTDINTIMKSLVEDCQVHGIDCLHLITQQVN